MPIKFEGSCGDIDWEITQINDQAITLAMTEFRLSHVGVQALRDKHDNVQGIELELRVARYYSYYLFKVALPMSMIGLASCAAFTLGDEHADQLAHLTTMFLTAVAFQLIVADSMPSLSYLTIIDKYILAMYAALATSMLGIAGTSWAAVKEWESQPSETLMLIMSVVIWVLVHLIFGIYSCVAIANAQAATNDAEVNSVLKPGLKLEPKTESEPEPKPTPQP
eukprot:SAG11_NODE_656_length_7905_cov_4.191007_2_plen_223_part_00